MNYEDTLILFGRSPFISKIADKVPALCAKWHTMGCNYFVDTFPMVESVIFYDDIVPKVKKQHLLVTNVKHYNEASCKSAVLCRTHKKCEFYHIIRTRDGFSDPYSGDLFFDFHTPSMAMNWARNKGYRNVILAGIDLVYKSAHFDAATAPDKAVADWYEKDLVNARLKLKWINDTGLLSLYQLNPDSDIDIPKISIDKLL